MTSLIGISEIEMYDNVISTRFFTWRQERDKSRPWWKALYLGADENCNRTIGLNIPGGILWIVLNPRIRQKPCAECEALD